MSKPDERREPLVKQISRNYSRMNATARRQRLELLIGIFGFFTAVAFVITLVAEVQGKSALKEAAVLALFVLLTFSAVRAWKRS